MAKKPKPGAPKTPRTPRNHPSDVVWQLRGKDGATMLEEFPKHAMRISYFIAEYSALEHKLVSLLALMFTTKRAPIIPMLYALESSGGRIEQLRAGLRAILKQNRPNLVASFDKVLDEARSLLTQRNKWAHALWGKNTRTGELMKIDPDDYEATEVRLHEIDYQLLRVKKLSDRIGYVLEKPIQKMREQSEAAAATGDRPTPSQDSSKGPDRPSPAKPPES